MLFKTKEPTLAERLAEVQTRIKEATTERTKLVNAVRQAEADAQAEIQLGNSYRTDGKALIGVSDEEVEVLQPRRQRDKLRKVETARAAVEAFDAAHDIAALRDEEKRIQALIESEADASAVADDLADCAELIQHLENARQVRRRIIERRGVWAKRKIFRDEDLVQHGVFELEVPSNPASSLLASIKLIIGRQHPSLIPDGDPIRAKIEQSLKEGFVWSSLQYPTR